MRCMTLDYPLSKTAKTQVLDSKPSNSLIIREDKLQKTNLLFSLTVETKLSFSDAR